MEILKLNNGHRRVMSLCHNALQIMAGRFVLYVTFLVRLLASLAP